MTLLTTCTPGTRGCWDTGLQLAAWEEVERWLLVGSQLGCSPSEPVPGMRHVVPLSQPGWHCPGHWHPSSVCGQSQAQNGMGPGSCAPACTGVATCVLQGPWQVWAQGSLARAEAGLLYVSLSWCHSARVPVSAASSLSHICSCKICETLGTLASCQGLAASWEPLPHRH